jgi:hypothetical protein
MRLIFSPSLRVLVAEQTAAKTVACSLRPVGRSPLAVSGSRSPFDQNLNLTPNDGNRGIAESAVVWTRGRSASGS